ncbi:uncharacterized protein LOC131802631 [Musca domestica]|uniref:Uncharacterized protein LOC131802631 n=1 Tax=Musca domestica TaxID=7370 RepID=A0ABM3UZM1_MUSDO|nr:uncharacterized protein LOC131802631 [Musca domestica]
MINWIIIMVAFTTATKAQTLDIQDLSNNNGYIPIKTGETKTIEHYTKILHIINTTEYERTLETIKTNIDILKTSNTESKRLLDTVNKNFMLLKAKIENLNPHFRKKRALLNILGKGLKIIAGTMDSDDEKQINETFQLLRANDNNLTDKINNLTYISNIMNSQIQNITNHINYQQNIIGNYLTKLKNIIGNKISTMEEEITFIEHIYQINNDISLLQQHVDDIGQIIFSSKLGIIPTDILTQTELNLITDFDSYTNIKVTIALHDNNVIIILSIPHFSKDPLSMVTFVPIPDKNNRSIQLNYSDVLIDLESNVYSTYIKDNLKRNLIKIEDNCLNNILKFEEANCKMQPSNKQEVTEIIPGILILKNFNNKITHNCNKAKLRITGNFLIKFENCEINTLNKTFTNIKIKIHDKFILPNLITKIKENSNTTLADIKIESLYLKQIEYEETLKQALYKDKNTKIISFGIDVSIIVSICILVIFIYIIKNKNTYVTSVQLKDENIINNGIKII